MNGTRNCTVPGCDRTHYGKGLCKLHYGRLARTGTVGPAGLTRAPNVYSTRTTCQVPGCHSPVDRRDYCTLHIDRVRKSGTPGPLGRITKPRPDCYVTGCPDKATTSRDTFCATHRAEERWIERLWASVEPTGFCWNWTGRTATHGYGIVDTNDLAIRTLARLAPHPIPHDQARWRAHRLIYNLLVGPIPNDRVLDHLCRNQVCVNPDHLEVVTQAVNVWRSNNNLVHSMARPNLMDEDAERSNLMAGAGQ